MKYNILPWAPDGTSVGAMKDIAASFRSGDQARAHSKRIEDDRACRATLPMIGTGWAPGDAAREAARANLA
ncbi:hypothetical protein LJR296_007966 [Cupriavidus necator]|uniref:hypothetical protein n=1 Tax=Cupriavidus necator TaxID=106590 RepID=UPI003ECF15B9